MIDSENSFGKPLESCMYATSSLKTAPTAILEQNHLSEVSLMNTYPGGHVGGSPIQENCQGRIYATSSRLICTRSDIFQSSKRNCISPTTLTIKSWSVHFMAQKKCVHPTVWVQRCFRVQDQSTKRKGKSSNTDLDTLCVCQWISNSLFAGVFCGHSEVNALELSDRCSHLQMLSDQSLPKRRKAISDPLWRSSSR